MICNLVFDMGEVLLRYEPYISCMRYAKGDKELAQKLMAAVFDHPDWEVADNGLIALEEQTLNAQHRVSDAQAAALIPSLLRDWYLDGLWPYPGAENCVRQLHAQGWPLYILSNACMRFPEFEHKILTLDCFRGVMFSAAEKLLKPDKAIYLRLCKKYGLKPEECLFIDDRAVNVAGAETAGMTGYLFDGDHGKLLQYINSLKK